MWLIRSGIHGTVHIPTVMTVVKSEHIFDQIACHAKFVRQVTVLESAESRIRKYGKSRFTWFCLCCEWKTRSPFSRRSVGREPRWRGTPDAQDDHQPRWCSAASPQMKGLCASLWLWRERVCYWGAFLIHTAIMHLLPTSPCRHHESASVYLPQWVPG